MKMHQRNAGAAETALLIHPMLSSAEGIALCVTDRWGGEVHCLIPDLSGHGEAAGPAMAGRFIAMDETSIRGIIHDCAYVRLPELSPEMQRCCVFAYGEKDSDLGQCRKLLAAKYPGAALRVWPGYGHCGRMTADSQQYAAMLRAYMEKGTL